MTISSTLFDFYLDPINPEIFSTACTFCCSGYFGSSISLSYSISHSRSATQSPALSFGLSKSPFRLSSVRNSSRYSACGLVMARGSVQVGSRPSKTPCSPCHCGVVTQSGHTPIVLWVGCTRPMVQLNHSAYFRLN